MIERTVIDFNIMVNYQLLIFENFINFRIVIDFDMVITDFNIIIINFAETITNFVEIINFTSHFIIDFNIKISYLVDFVTSECSNFSN